MLEVAQLVEAPDCDSGCCGFDSHPSTQYIPLVLAAARMSPKHQGGVQIPGGMPIDIEYKTCRIRGRGFDSHLRGNKAKW